MKTKQPSKKGSLTGPLPTAEQELARLRQDLDCLCVYAKETLDITRGDAKNYATEYLSGTLSGDEPGRRKNYRHLFYFYHGQAEAAKRILHQLELARERTRDAKTNS